LFQLNAEEDFKTNIKTAVCWCGAMESLFKTARSLKEEKEKLYVEAC
jgi:hypothetical protein